MISFADKLSIILAVIGCLNWGGVGLFSYNLAESILGGPDSLLTRAVYVVIAASGIWCITLLFKDRSR